MLASSRDALALWRFALGRHGPLDHDERMSTSSRCSSASVSSIEDIARMNAGITTPLISCCKSIGSPESANRSHLPGRLATRRRQWQRSLLAAHDPSSVSAASAAAVDKVFRRGSAAAGNALPPALYDGRRHRRRVPHPSRNPDRDIDLHHATRSTLAGSGRRQL